MRLKFEHAVLVRTCDVFEIICGSNVGTKTEFILSLAG